MSTCPKCRTALIPFGGYESVPCKCVAGRMNRKAESDALKLAIRKEGLSDTDANLAKKYGRNAHHIYMVREKLGIHKYRTDDYIVKRTRQNRAA